MRFNVYQRDDVFNEQDGWKLDQSKARVIYASLPSSVLDALNDEDMEADFPWDDMNKVLCECLGTTEIKNIGGDCYMLNFEFVDSRGKVYYVEIEDSNELFLNLNTDIGVANYVSPRSRSLNESEKSIRDCAYNIKNGDMYAIHNAAIQMSSYVDESSILVPLPSSQNDTSSNLLLAKAISDLSGSSVVDMLYRSEPVESSSKRRINGYPGLSPAQHYIAAHKPEFEFDTSKVVFIDNVITSGATGHAAKMAVGGGRVLAYAFAKDEAQSRKIDVIINDQLMIECKELSHDRSHIDHVFFSYDFRLYDASIHAQNEYRLMDTFSTTIFTVVEGELYDANDFAVYTDYYEDIPVYISPVVHIDGDDGKKELYPYIDLFANTALSHHVGKSLNYPVLDLSIESDNREIMKLKERAGFKFEDDEFVPLVP